MIAHGFIITNMYNLHDATTPIRTGMMSAVEGRWFQGAYVLTAGLIETPFLTGVLVLLYLSLSAILVRKLLDIRNNVVKVLICVIMVAKYVVISRAA